MEEDLELWLRSQSTGKLKKPKKNPKNLLSPYSQTGGLEQIQSNKKLKIRFKSSLQQQQQLLPSLKQQQQSPQSPQSQQHPPQDYTKEEIAVKTITLPYANTFLFVEESMRIINEWTPPPPSQQITDLTTNHLSNKVSSSQIISLQKRYPRFCEGLNFNQETTNFKIRSDLWLVRIIEESYDAASRECTKQVSAARARQRHNLDLGAMDSFPQSVRRYISQKYSVLNICPQICLEILLAIDRIMSVSDKVCMNRQIEETVVCDSGRVYLFSSFLSEEMDVDRLAAYLQIRDITQEAAGFYFKDVIAHMQHANPSISSNNMSPTRDDNPDLVDILDSSSSKICPLKLPFHLRILKDASMPEAPLLAVDLRALSVICHKVTPQSTTSARKYLFNKILFWVVTLIRRKSSIFRMLEYFREDTSSFLECQYEGTIVEGLAVVPAHVIIWAICTEFSYYKGEQAVSIAEALHGDGPKEAATSEQGLAILNRLYDNNRALMSALEAEIVDAELKLSHWKTKIIDIERKKRKIERKWKDFQPDFQLRGVQALTAEENKGYDLNELSSLKMLLLEAEGERSSAEAIVKRLKKKRSSLNTDIESLWDSTLSGGTSQKKTLGSMKGRLDWREMILTRISDAINSNSLFSLNLIPTKSSQPVTKGPMEQIHSPEEGMVPPPSEHKDKDKDKEKDNFDTKDKSFGMSITEQIAALEAEAKKLATIGINFNLEEERGVTSSSQSHPAAVDDVDSETIHQTTKEESPRVVEDHWMVMIHEIATSFIQSLIQAQLHTHHLRSIATPEITGTIPDIIVTEQVAPVPLEPSSDPSSTPVAPSDASVLNFGLFLFEDAHTTRLVDLFLQSKKRLSILHFWNFLSQRWKATQSFLRRQRKTQRLMIQRFQQHSAARKMKRERVDTLLESFFQQKHSLQIKKGFLWWRKTAHFQKLLKEKCIVKIQSVARRLLARIKVRKLRLLIERRERAIECSLMNLEKHNLRRAVQKLLAWKKYHQNLRQAAYSLQIRRLSPRFIWWKKLFAQVRISYAIRQSLARRNLKIRRQKAIQLGEYFLAIPSVLAKYRTRSVLLHWRILTVISTIFRLTYRNALNTKVSRSMETWKIFTSKAVNKRNLMATKIQSCYRMHLSIKHKMNFYVMRKEMIALQCIVRKRIATEVVALARKRHFSAIALQKIIRGYTFRVQLRRKRIQDIHEAAKSNNYDRLLHYCDYFYNLTFQLDEFGNTALHNAAKFASKRCLKLLMKYYHDPSVTNPEGYTPLHLLIMSAAPARDEVFDYMIEVGFDEEQLTTDGKNALLLACEYGRIRIANQCLQAGQDPNQKSTNGSTSLQFACQNGYEPLVRSLLEHGADPNLSGANGMFPLHDVAYSGNIDIANHLLKANANLNVIETINGWTPLMMACRMGLEDLVDLFLAQAPDVMALDYSWCNAAHHSAVSNSIRIANSLREAEVDFYALDYEGNSPLHYAAQYGSVDIMREFLFSGAPASLQNNSGNQPSHIAAQYNQVECLKLLSRYDQHMGRMNYNHQTPLGMAKFHLAHASQKFLEEYFRKIDGDEYRNQDGDIWWDKEIDTRFGDWKQVIDEANHRHFINVVTGEISLNPPSISSSTVQRIAEYAQIPMRMKVLPQDEENRLNRKVYNQEYEDTQKSIDQARKLYRAATVITKFARRKLAYKIVENKRIAIRRLQVLGRFVRRATDVLMKWRIIARTKKWIRVQALFRGYSLRCHFYYWDGTYQYLWYELAKRRLARTIWNLWRNYKLHLLQTTVHVATTAPRLLSEWEKILDQAGYPLRVVGFYEEYLYPGTKKIYFYRNIETGTITFHKPKDIEKKDLMDYRAKQMYLEKGFTPAQLKLALKLQALWRGHKIRTMYIFITKATSICVHAEKKFLTDPDSDRNLFNYTLYCHVVLNDYERARPLYLEALRRMTFKGPDVAQILYSYAIFAFVVHDQDISDCLELISRARTAERLHYNLIRKQQQRAFELSGGKECSAYVEIEITTGKSFELANVGFFRYMCNLKGTSEAYHNYAACRFLVFSDFPGSFDAFMGAFKTDPLNHKLRDNYDAMMRHFFGNQNLIDEEMNRRMRILADKDHHEKMMRQERIDLWNHKIECATTIQKWYRHHRDLFKFRAIVDKLRRKKKNSSTHGRK